MDPLTTFSLDSFDASTVDLIVEGNKYTVHRFFLDRDSPVLREMFKSPPVTEGGWTLSSVTKIEFEHLLWMYYNPVLDYYFAPRAVWRDVLRLADMWKMDRLKRIALHKLLAKRLKSIERIALCERDDAGRWMAKAAYIEICTRTEPLTSAEFQALGMDTVLLIMQIRERIIASRSGEEQGAPGAVGAIVDDIIGTAPPMELRVDYDSEEE
ncbi:hypothetical protein C8R46DRAFT_1097114 [Mycena filopes]|nr:hypothetical protein C8R46DRAFT_1097114 [Mycena filopes]